MNGSGHQSPQQTQRQSQQQDRHPTGQYQPPALSYLSSQDVGLNRSQEVRPLDARAMAANENDFMQFNPFLAAAGGTPHLPPRPAPSAPLRMPLPDAPGPSTGPSGGTPSTYDFGVGMSAGTPDSNSQSKKKKRRPLDSPSAAAASDEKRTKTGRACDACVSAHWQMKLTAALEEDPLRHPTIRRREPAHLRPLQAVQHRVHVLPPHHRDALQETAPGRCRGIPGQQAGPLERERGQDARWASINTLTRPLVPADPLL